MGILERAKEMVGAERIEAFVEGGRLRKETEVTALKQRDEQTEKAQHLL